MTSKGLDDERGISVPFGTIGDDEALKALLAAGPPEVEHDVEPEFPAVPWEASDEEPVAEASPSLEPEPEQPKKTASPFGTDSGPDAEARKAFLLPDEATTKKLKAKFGELRVVPMPFDQKDGKTRTYVLRKLTRGQWRAMEDMARKTAEAKGVADAGAMEIFREKVVCSACVWPAIDETKISLLPPGLVSTLYGVIQQMGLFFDPEVIMQVTFQL